jgi:hypothetical protein
MSTNITTKNGFDTIPPNRPVGLWYQCAKGHWTCDGRDIDPETQLAVLLDSWQDGEILWRDQKIAGHKIQSVAEKGLFDALTPGFNRYTAVMLMDQAGRLGTFTSSSWGGHYAVLNLVPQFQLQGRRAFPICT